MRRGWKVWLAVLLLIFLAAAPAAQAAEEEASLEEELQKQADLIDLGPWQAYWEAFSRDTQAGSGSFADFLLEVAQGKISLSVDGLWNGLARAFGNNLWQMGSFAGQILASAILLAILEHMASARLGGDGNRVASMVVQWGIIGSMAVRLLGAFGQATETMEGMLSFCSASVPVLLSLTAAAGGGITAGLLQPTVMGILTLISNVLQRGLVQLLYGATLLSLISHLRQDDPLGGIAGLLRGACQWVLGAILTLFVAARTRQSATGVTVDGVSLRTAKYAVDTAIPFAGGMISDMVDTVVGCSLMIRSALGVAGLGILLWLSLPPLLTLGGFYWVMRAAAAVSKPMGTAALGSCLESMAKSVLLLFIMLLFVCIVLFVIMAMTIGIGNTLYMAGG